MNLSVKNKTLPRLCCKALLICGVLCWSAQASAESCSDLYRAIRTEAMYCGFFCDQDRLLPLQQAYEANCITFLVPLSALPLETPIEALPASLVRAESAAHTLALPPQNPPVGPLAGNEFERELTWWQETAANRPAEQTN
jgi:hypothetical protein